MAYDERIASGVRQVLAQRDGFVVEKKMMGGLCFMVAGHLCCAVRSKGGLLVRVGSDAGGSLLGEPHVEPMRMGKRTLRGYVRVAPEGVKTAAQLQRWVLRGVACVESLPARTSTRRPRSRSRTR